MHDTIYNLSDLGRRRGEKDSNKRAFLRPFFAALIYVYEIRMQQSFAHVQDEEYMCKTHSFVRGSLPSPPHPSVYLGRHCTYDVINILPPPSIFTYCKR